MIVLLKALYQKNNICFQETIFMILRTKMIQDGKPHRILAAYISYISQVHSFANRSISEWGKFYHYKPKIFLSNPWKFCFVMNLLFHRRTPNMKQKYSRLVFLGQDKYDFESWESIYRRLEQLYCLYGRRCYEKLLWNQ